MPVQGAPRVSGFTFRRVSKDDDFDKIASVMNASWAADKVDAMTTSEDIKKDFDHPVDINPGTDWLVAMSGDEVAGFSKVSSRLKPNSDVLYWHYAYVAPRFMKGGLRMAMIQWNEDRIASIAKERPDAKSHIIETYANGKEESDWRALIEKIGYRPAWFLFEMVCSDLDHIPDLPLPEGVETRPFKDDDLQRIWAAAKEAMRDERNFTEERWSEENLKREQMASWHTPHLWMIACEGDEVVGGVLNYIDVDENKALGRTWGHTERIFVRRPWRKKGIARALIARSLRLMKEQGMEKATLDVDTENPSGALRIYESLGYVRERQYTFYHKKLS